jgi:hypothetical protein
MIYYTNLQLSELNTKYYRIAYTAMDVLGDAGGMLEAVLVILATLLIPLNYNLTAISMLKEYFQKGEH